jgi:sensor histidine kinase YesM
VSDISKGWRRRAPKHVGILVKQCILVHEKCCSKIRFDEEIIYYSERGTQDFFMICAFRRIFWHSSSLSSLLTNDIHVYLICVIIKILGFVAVFNLLIALLWTRFVRLLFLFFTAVYVLSVLGSLL